MTKPKACKIPCKTCPWKRDSIAGYLGGNKVEVYSSALSRDERLQCHTLTKDITSQSARTLCQGYIRSRVKACKMAKMDKALQKQEQAVRASGESLENYFMFAKEFEDHHNT